MKQIGHFSMLVVWLTYIQRDEPVIVFSDTDLTIAWIRVLPIATSHRNVTVWSLCSLECHQSSFDCLGLWCVEWLFSTVSKFCLCESVYCCVPLSHRLRSWDGNRGLYNNGVVCNIQSDVCLTVPLWTWKFSHQCYPPPPETKNSLVLLISSFIPFWIDSELPCTGHLKINNDQWHRVKQPLLRCVHCSLKQALCVAMSSLMYRPT